MEIQVTRIRVIMVNASDIAPICFAFVSFDFRYLMVHQRKSGGRRMLTAYNPNCVHRVVERGLSLTFFPQVGQKNAVASMGLEQNGQIVCVGGNGSTLLY